MLHIERKVGESIRLGNDIQVIVTKAANGTVRLAFEAPKEVKIYREEIYQRIQNEKHPDHTVSRSTSLGITAEDGNLWLSKKGVSP